ncbi:bifunctional [glutamate--ammonia ligase]-adenylyl-L-tyrosine phosphorylase/[glutamate--ammonia-ligase] adenylyltransferase [Erythrobacteraceae bacterium CFH 75059]|uniref:bifunctional [glutamate--ammonia ligase]-adenylyl-L-tyrosine phosphorylase/[glutamate--ammonia-ligase] adenylyltransferase n=1 Tax=Qipengyuania thermophila TaxID=2509361 RepID=UPI001020410B|nr:bifunctional [glutamate--ammonia ligase]-adenylyl-L-tyrosine phosphorylase/[glutamate--ammonia-ligase] adenylyltransferase [Qipengyuania thermophila]TCD06570.1 bifunctional [glutamate--ammonia ligase]-adenylyl-L-tyrosine phosphorylase/[glutamate--ammonia-ligase] adenylyltransferase [Erythrobacteraceae bacterium CFH 75059]
MAEWTEALDRARAHAPFLARQQQRFPDLAALLGAGRFEDALAAAYAQGDAGGELGAVLRRQRAAVSLVLAIGDLAGAVGLERVTHTLSALADRALDRASRTVIAQRTGHAAEPLRGFVVLALGKHGGRELNYSSDIDPILLYEPDTLPRRPRDEPGEAAQRYARGLVQLLAAVTADGFVFRVDLRLRPASEVSPPAVPIAAALSHYEGSALPWERAAFIKARAAAGDLETGGAFLDAIRPFVWRRSLDFGTIDDIRQLVARIRTEQRGPPAPEPGFNLKLGRGGIREIEFLAQALQLIHGGRNPALRSAATLDALNALAEAGLLPAGQAAALADSYRVLRTAEHRLQMVGDQQTHTLPAGDALEDVARLGGWPTGSAWLDHLRAVCAPVASAFDALLQQQQAPRPAVGPAVDAERAHLEQRIAAWTPARFRVLRSEAARRALADVAPRLIDALLETGSPDQAAGRMEGLLERLPSAVNMFRLLEARPALIVTLSSILSLAPPLAEQLARRPTLLDALIDRSALDLPGTAEELAAQMGRAGAGPGLEAQLNGIRIVTGEVRFALGVQLIESAHDPLLIGAALARLADAGLRRGQAVTQDAFAGAHGRLEGGELIVLGLGRLGGGLLTHASDLDLIYLFTGDLDRQSDGPRPLGTTLYFNRLAQRVSASLAVPTAQGSLYEVDTRLRPQGSKGPLAVSMDAFARYQHEEAWTWEHMALMRARVITGSPAARYAVDTVIAAVLEQPRRADTLRRDVLKMRADMAAHGPPSGPLDTKRMRGGLTDLEFLLHYLQLRERRFLDPDLAAVLRRMIEAHLCDEDLLEAHDTLNRVLIAARLLAPDGQVPAAAAAAALARTCGMTDAAALLRAVDTARLVVARAWRQHFETELPLS